MEADVHHGDHCEVCCCSLLVPFIQCRECSQPNTMICLQCFTRGRETHAHKSDHRYSVVKHDFSLFEPGWTAEEEMRLLSAISECGVGNWQDIANQVRNKTGRQCEQHYTSVYLENPKDPLPKILEDRRTFFPSPVTYRPCEEPPRPAEGSLYQLEMSGYLAARGDFTHEYDNFAEMDLREIAFNPEEDPAEKAIKLAVVDIYRGRLKERMRRKRIVRDYGLIDIKKTLATSRRHERVLGGMVESLRVFAKLFPPIEFDKYLEALQYETELKRSVLSLQDQRSAGLSKLASAELYEQLKARRDEERGQPSMLSEVLQHMQDESACQQWLQKQGYSPGSEAFINIAQLKMNPSRRMAPPLDIQHLPGYERLNEKERELCATIRLIPESYLEFRKLLVNEYTKLGFLKLAQARTLIKIDVNKTRKLFDFLVSEGVIQKDCQ